MDTVIRKKKTSFTFEFSDVIFAFYLKIFFLFLLLLLLLYFLFIILLFFFLSSFFTLFFFPFPFPFCFGIVVACRSVTHRWNDFWSDSWTCGFSASIFSTHFSSLTKVEKPGRLRGNVSFKNMCYTWDTFKGGKPNRGLQVISGDSCAQIVL